jgi:hypothetical protein
MLKKVNTAALRCAPGASLAIAQTTPRGIDRAFGKWTEAKQITSDALRNQYLTILKDTRTRWPGAMRKWTPQ